VRNTLPVIPQARAPRGLVKLNGEVVPGWIDWQVDNNTFYQADTFRVRFASSMLPAAYGPAWFASQSAITVELLAGFPADPAAFSAAELDSLFYGKVDDITYDPTSTLIELSGRDLTADLIDNKTTEKWQNLTSSQIVTKIAQRHGLNPKVAATKTKAGKYYEIDHVRLTHQRSEWDLLTWLAHQEQYVVYVRGQDLHFEPMPSASTDPYVLEWTPPTADNAAPGFNGKTILFARNLTLAKDVIVEVRSWNAKNKKGFTKKAQATHNKNTVLSGAAQPIGEAQTYSFTVPGLTPEQALQFAQNKLREITAHEVKMTATLPADNVLLPTDVIQVRGTATPFDQIYYPDSIVRTMSLSDGYAMTVNAKNHSPESVVAP